MTRFSILILLAFIAFTPVRGQQGAEALSDFEAALDDVIPSLDGLRTVHDLSGGWAGIMYSSDPDEYDYDVKRSESLVSPFIAVLHIPFTANFTEFHRSERDAEDDFDYVQEREGVLRARFEFRRGKWVIETIERQTDGVDSWYDAPDWHPYRIALEEQF